MSLKTEDDGKDDESKKQKTLSDGWKSVFAANDNPAVIDELAELQKSNDYDFFFELMVREKLADDKRTKEEGDEIRNGWNLYFAEKRDEIVLRCKTVIVGDLLKTFIANSSNEARLWLYAQKYIPGLKKNWPRSIAMAGIQAFLKSQSLTIEETLKQLSPVGSDEGIKNIETFDVASDPVTDGSGGVTGGSGRAYYLSSASAVNFRHQGEPGRVPSRLYLRPLTQEKNKGKVLVFYSASGSGKTVELAGSSVTRGAHLTVVVKAKDEEYVLGPGDPEAKEGDTPRDTRNHEKLTCLGRKMKSLFSSHYSEFKALIKAAEYEGKPLKLVLAIDEASSCPELVRSIIADPSRARKEVHDGLAKALGKEGKKLPLTIDFSVAGTGASASTARSEPDNFEVEEPTYVVRSSSLRKHLLGGLKRLVPGGGGEKKKLADVIEEYLPVVAVMMENGRMASIACAVLQEHDEDTPLDESAIVSRIAKKFMLSNGLVELINRGAQTRRHCAAAAALAVHLFQDGAKHRVLRTGEAEGATKSFPSDPSEYEKDVLAMDFAVTLVRYDNDQADVKRIVSKYGLLEPNNEKKEGQTGQVEEQLWGAGLSIKKPFLMRPAQQLIALYMLDVRLENMLQATPYGFETLSTHMVKCAIAASLMIDKSVRPNVQDVLSKIGFMIDEGTTHDDVLKEWRFLKECKAIGSRCNDDDYQTAVNSFWETRQLQSEVILASCTQDPPNKGKKKVLLVDEEWYKALHGRIADENVFSPPVAGINYGNSPYADGFITFNFEAAQPAQGPTQEPAQEPAQGPAQVSAPAQGTPRRKSTRKTRKSTERTGEQAEETAETKEAEQGDEPTLPAVQVPEYTIMNQAKDYHNSSSLDSERLKNHVKRHKRGDLNGMFRGHRLLCVASSKRVVHSNGGATKRGFMPYCVDQSALLGDLLDKMAAQRNQQERIKKFAVACDVKGKMMKEDRWKEPKVKLDYT